ncbi:MAG TPA: glycosyltransferase family 2 protein [Terriglobia bacterium]|nr:glycosyltransferase family 2 protein [Terriglobia bacterium]
MHDHLEPAPVSVLILTRDEELNIAHCLESVRWAAEVFVVDSLSTDRTAEIARSLGAKVYAHDFQGYARQRNWALDHLPFSCEWVLMLDADERVPQALAEEIHSVLGQDSDPRVGYYIAPRLFFLGRWLKHGGLYPTWLLRLYKRSAARVEERHVNEHVMLDGAAGYLTQPFDHVDRRPLGHWVAKHNRYADLEAEDYLRERSRPGLERSIPVSLWGSQAGRKRWIKLRVWNRLPVLLRPFLFFWRNYLFKGGFLDGRAGFIYHVLWSFWYPFLVGAKVVEQETLDQRAGATLESPQSDVNALSKVTKA